MTGVTNRVKNLDKDAETSKKNTVKNLKAISRKFTLLRGVNLKISLGFDLGDEKSPNLIFFRNYF